MMPKRNIKTLFAACIVLIAPLDVTRANDIDVLTIFAPGSGSNYVKKGIMPAGTDSQVAMYDELPDALGNLDFESLQNYVELNEIHQYNYLIHPVNHHIQL